MTIEKLKIEIGKTYVTRGCEAVHITKIDTDKPIFGITGVFVSGKMKGTSADWGHTGHHHLFAEYGLVRELGAPIHSCLMPGHCISSQCPCPGCLNSIQTKATPSVWTIGKNEDVILAQPSDGTGSDVVAALKLIRAFSPALLSGAGEATLKHAEKPPHISRNVWVNVYHKSDVGDIMHTTKEKAQEDASPRALRVAVPCRLEEIIDAG